jgi:hypothetical protein
VAVAEDLGPWDLVDVEDVVDLSGATPRPLGTGRVRFRTAAAGGCASTWPPPPRRTSAATRRSPGRPAPGAPRA